MLDDPGLYPEQNKTYSRNCWFRTFLEAIKCLLPRPHQPSLTAISQSSQSLSGGLKCVHHFACIYSQIVIIHSIHISYCIPRYEYPQVSPKDWYIYIYIDVLSRQLTAANKLPFRRTRPRLQSSRSPCHSQPGHGRDMVDMVDMVYSISSAANESIRIIQVRYINYMCIYIYTYIYTYYKLLWYIILIWSYLDVLYMWIITKPSRNSPEMSGTIL